MDAIGNVVPLKFETKYWGVLACSCSILEESTIKVLHE